MTEGNFVDSTDGSLYRYPDLGDVGRIARKLHDERGSRWGVQLRSRTSAFDSGSTFTEVEVWKSVDEDYDQSEAVRLGWLRRNKDLGLHVALVDGLDDPTLRWFIKLAQKRHVPVAPPPSMRKVMDLMTEFGYPLASKEEPGGR